MDAKYLLINRSATCLSGSCAMSSSLFVGGIVGHNSISGASRSSVDKIPSSWAPVSSKYVFKSSIYRTPISISSIYIATRALCDCKLTSSSIAMQCVAPT